MIVVDEEPDKTLRSLLLLLSSQLIKELDGRMIDLPSLHPDGKCLKLYMLYFGMDFCSLEDALAGIRNPQDVDWH